MSNKQGKTWNLSFAILLGQIRVLFIPICTPRINESNKRPSHLLDFKTKTISMLIILDAKNKIVKVGLVGKAEKCNLRMLRSWLDFKILYLKSRSLRPVFFRVLMLVCVTYLRTWNIKETHAFDSYLRMPLFFQPIGQSILVLTH